LRRILILGTVIIVIIVIHTDILRGEGGLGSHTHPLVMVGCSLFSFVAVTIAIVASLRQHTFSNVKGLKGFILRIVPGIHTIVGLQRYLQCFHINAKCPIDRAIVPIAEQGIIHFILGWHLLVPQTQEEEEQQQQQHQQTEMTSKYDYVDSYQ
jgi:hypothetical protein